MDIDQLKAKVDAETTVVASTITLLGSLSAQIAAAKNDPAKIQAIADEIDANSVALAQAVQANTPGGTGTTSVTTTTPAPQQAPGGRPGHSHGGHKHP